MLFQKGKVLARKLENDDKYILSKWLSNPEILQYYEGRDTPFDVEKVEKEFYNAENVIRLIIEFDGTPIGYCQYYTLGIADEYAYGYYNRRENICGMDQFIGESAYWNRGIGATVVSSVVSFLIQENGVDLIAMDPQTWNERAIRCYEKCGFKKVKLLPDHELHEGKYSDCWLMEYHKK